MLLVLPTVRRRCSVRSVATAAKPAVSSASSSTPDSEPSIFAPPDRAAALAHSKWAPKPKPPLETGFSNTDSRASSGGTASLETPLFTEVKLSATSKWARKPAAPTPSFASSAMKSTTRTTPDPINPTRSRWPSLAETDRMSASRLESLESATDRWAARSETPPGLAQGALSERPRLAEKSAMQQPQELPPHLQWQRPEPSPSNPPASSSASTRLDTIIPRPPSNDDPPHDPRLQRSIAPHLDPSLTQTLRPLTFSAESPPKTPRSDLSEPSRSENRPAKQAHVPAPNVESVPERNPRSKYAFKERGSLLKTATNQSLMVQPKTATQKVKKAGNVVEKHVTRDVYIPSTVSVEHLSKLLGVRLEDLQEKMRQAGMEAQASFDYVLTSDYAILLAEEYGCKPIVNDEAAFDLYPPPPHPEPASLPHRPPVVTIMGHVDHGKTTLLDTLRSSSVAKGEVGGITQHIGAFSVPVPSSAESEPQSITFLDTPGHAAFSAMRARGAQVTDIIVLVVAADDGIMPQTREVIELIKKDRDKLGVVVAINKIDKPGCDVDALQKALLVEDIHLEDLGGDTPSVEVSGLTGKGLPALVETLSLIADIQDIRAERDGKVFGYVLESKVVKGLGIIATVLVLRGSLTPGSHILSGVHHAKVRLMQDSNGKTVKAASPGMAVTVSGWKSLPSAGDEVLQGTESEIKKAITNRQRKIDMETSMADVEAINSSRHQERERRQAEAAAEAAGSVVDSEAKEKTPSGPKELRLIIKADVSGSAEAVEGALQGIGNHLAMTKVISSGVGEIVESDVMRAKAAGGMIVGFSVSVSRAVETLAAQHDVPIIRSDIIYRLMEDVKERVIALLPVIIEFKVLGEAKVLQLFDIQAKGKQMKTVAGSRVINGILEKNKPVRVVRDGTVIHEGSFETMRHFKKDVTELRKGTECGLNLAGFDSLQADDIIQAYETIEKPGIL